MISSISTIWNMKYHLSYENTSVVPDTKILVWISASVAEAVVVNPNGTRTLLANGWSTFF